jgi:DNA polymerase III sliding clamp (beta) subunit (PCNA family)
MHAILARAPLVDDLRLAERILPVRSPDAVSQCVLFRAVPGGCSLVTRDHELTLWLELHADVERPGAALLPARRLLAFAREVDAETVRAQEEGTVATWTAPGVTFRLRGEDPSRFPEPVALPAQAQAILPADAVEKAVRRTLFAVARGPGYSREYTLEGVLLEVDPPVLRVVGSDNRRLAVAEVRFLAYRGLRPGRLLIPARGVALLGRLAREQGGEVRVCFGAEHAFFRTGRATLCVRLLWGRYPSWRATVPEVENVVELPVAALTAAVRQAAVLREGSYTRVTARLYPDRIVVESTSGRDHVRVEHPVAYEGGPVGATFNSGHLVELLRALEAEDRLQITLTGPEDPALFVAEGYRHLLMPLLPHGVAPDSVFVAAPSLAVAR